MQRVIKQVVLMSMIVILAGCAATSTMISKRNLDVQTKMSETIFLDPADSGQKTVFLQFRNTSDKADFTIQETLEARLHSKGYQVVTKPSQATYILQANILQVGKTDPSAAEKFLLGGFGGQGAVSGALAAGAFNSSGSGMAGAALAGGVIDLVANAAVKDVYFSVVTDIQLTENVAGQPKVHKTRIVSTANKVNLDFKEALPALQEGLITSISGLF